MITSDSWIVRLNRWVEQDPNIRLALLVGSQARTEMPADSLSDIDLALFARHPALLLRESDWVAKLGGARTIHREPNGLGSGDEVRVLFEDGQDVDFSVFPFAGLGPLLLYHVLKRFIRSPGSLFLRDPNAKAVLARGFRVLTNKDGIRLPALVELVPPKLPTPEEFTNVANDYWFHLIWTAKKLKRGELLTAWESTNGYLRNLLVRAIRWHALVKSNRAVDVWHGTRFFESWADPRAVRAFGGTVALYDPISIAGALRGGRDLFEWVGHEIEESLSIPPPVRDVQGLSRLLEQLLSS